MIAPQHRLIVALDVPTPDEAKSLVTTLGDSVSFYKIGLELFMAGQYFELIDWLKDRDKEVFADLKFYDVPTTVSRAVRQLNGRGIHFVTVHGDNSIMQAAADAKDDLKILAVTVLTSLNREDLRELGFHRDVGELVVARALNAMKYGCDGVIASGQEAKQLRRALAEHFLVVTPGIRFSESRDDQKRTVTPARAFENGADHIVVGRPIRDAEDPKATAEKIQAQIQTALT